MSNGQRIDLSGEWSERGGQQFVSGRGAFGNGFSAVHRIEPHGLMTNPVKGGKGLLFFPNGDFDEAYVLGGENPGLRPSGLPQGASALYDAAGNIIKAVMGDGIVVDVAGNAYTIRKGGVSLTVSAAGVDIVGGNVTHNGKNIGATHIHSGVVPGGGNTGAPV